MGHRFCQYGICLQSTTHETVAICFQKIFLYQWFHNIRSQVKAKQNLRICTCTSFCSGNPKSEKRQVLPLVAVFCSFFFEFFYEESRYGACLTVSYFRDKNSVWVWPKYICCRLRNLVRRLAGLHT